MDETPRRPASSTGPTSAEGSIPVGKRRPIERRPAAAQSAEASGAAPLAAAKPKPAVAKSGATKPAAAKPAAAKPATSNDVVKKKSVAAKKPAAEEEDDFSSLTPRAVGNTALPPRVVKKKKEAARADRPKRSSGSGWTSEPAEVLVPVVLIVVGLALNALSAVLLKSEWLSAGVAIGLNMAMVAVSTVVTIGALFAAAAVLDLSYGYLSTAILKVAAICVTQSWVGDLSSMIPVPFVGWLLSFGTTYAMFKFFFELDDMEAIGSMAIVNIVHWVAAAVVLVAIVAAIMSGTNVTIPGLDGAPDEMQFDEEMDDEEMDGQPPGNVPPAGVPGEDGDAGADVMDASTSRLPSRAGWGAGRYQGASIMSTMFRARRSTTSRVPVASDWPISGASSDWAASCITSGVTGTRC